MLTQRDWELYQRIFRGREGVLKTRSGNLLQGVSLTRERLQEQLDRLGVYGIYLRQADDTVYLAMFDLDVEDRQAPREQIIENVRGLKLLADDILRALPAVGLEREHCLVEFSGVGFHLWFSFAQPVLAAHAAQFLTRVRETAGVGIVAQKPEPRALQPGSMGECPWLPLRWNENSNMHSVFIADWDGFDPANYDSSPNFDPLQHVKQVPLAIVKGR